MGRNTIHSKGTEPLDLFATLVFSESWVEDGCRELKAARAGLFYSFIANAGHRYNARAVFDIYTYIPF